jgi:hypothetical protein
VRAGDELLGTVFNKDHRYVIPVFQRPYVWDEESNWNPLWGDLRKAAEDAETPATDDDEPREYFLGALVTQHRTPRPRRVPTSLVIDGQQRMTTFQVFLAAACRVATEVGAAGAADRFTALVANRVQADGEFPEDRYKVTPLEHDRVAFEWAVRAPGAVLPAPSSSHRLARAAEWFERTVRDWISESPDPAGRLDMLHFAVESRVKVVSIFLEAKDDPQVIFEALNHRGTRLDAADLVKNLLFQTLDRQGDAHLERELDSNHWAVLDGDHWRSEVTTGRIKRVKVNVLLAYWLSVVRGEETSVEHLFEDFKRWMKSSGARAADVIREIRVYADTMERLQSLPMTSPVAQVLDRLDATNTTTPWPLILFLHATPEIPADQAEAGTRAIDSFLMRRAICRMTTKDYNRLFGTLLGELKTSDLSTAGDHLVHGLASQTAESRTWPSDAAFVTGLANPTLYRDVVRARLRTLLVGVENFLLDSKAEPVMPHRAGSRAPSFSIEHVMPLEWEKNWPLPDGADDGDLARRQSVVHSLGNLTLATQSLNSTLSNQGWAEKRHTLQSHSLARITTGSILTSPKGVELSQDEWVATWDEYRIETRTMVLASHALDAWPRPASDGDETVSTSGEDAGAQGGRDVKFDHSTPTNRTRQVHAVWGDLLPLIRAGLIAPNDSLHHRKVRSGDVYTAIITDAGELKTDLGTYSAPSPALSKLVGYAVNGWKDWRHDKTGQSLAELRARL